MRFHTAMAFAGVLALAAASVAADEQVPFRGRDIGRLATLVLSETITGTISTPGSSAH